MTSVAITRFYPSVDDGVAFVSHSVVRSQPSTYGVGARVSVCVSGWAFPDPSHLRVAPCASSEIMASDYLRCFYSEINTVTMSKHPTTTKTEQSLNLVAQ